MIVADASAVVEMLLNTDAGGDIADRLLDREQTIAAPHLLDLEVLQVLRRFALAGDLDAERAEQAVTDFSDLVILRYPHEPLIRRIWDLRSNLTAYDAAYVALAEALDVPLLTRDTGIARSPGHSARVELV
jgi:predicted nucleic acid-binding protein